MRVLLVAVLAGALAAPAGAQIRPVRASDAGLLKRGATYEETIAQQVAARLTGLHPEVRCAPLGIPGLPSTVLGVTLFEGGHASDYFLMIPQMCRDLEAFRNDPARYDPRSCRDTACLATVASAAMALATVSHESYHLLGYTNEAQVECYGMQSIWFVATRLGASLPEAQALAQLFALRIYPLRRVETPTYWSAACRNGGTYDLRRSSSAWPS